MRNTGTDTDTDRPTARRRIHLTKEICLWTDCIERVYPAPGGGSFIVTDRGTSRVLEPTEQIEAYLAADGDAGGEVR